MFVLVFLNDINECNIECVFDTMMDMIMNFGSVGVQVWVFNHYVYLML